MTRADRPPTRLLQGSALILAGALLSCATAGGNPGERSRDARRAPDRRAAWLPAPPAGCAVGLSGPTLDPGDAIRQARSSALENLAAQLLGVRVESELRISAEAVTEFTRQDISGVMALSRIVAMDSDSDPDARSRHELREVYALACPAEIATPHIPRPGFPDWILDIPSEPDRICVPGVGGPTHDPRSQPDAALRDGRNALAHALESQIRQQSVDDGRRLPRLRSQTQSTERARAVAEAVDRLSESWLDRDGRGPLRIPGVLYGLVCGPY